MPDHFGARSTLRAACGQVAIYRLAKLTDSGCELDRLPFSMRVLLENMLRCEDGRDITADDVLAVARWDPKRPPDREVSFSPTRVILQDFTGVPCLVDLAAMRDAMVDLGGDPARVNPLLPVDLVIDHSVQVDAWGAPDALTRNVALEFERNRERYRFLKWGQQAFRNFRVVPPNTGIVHQVNLERLATVVCLVGSSRPEPIAAPDTLVGTDSHTTMINGLGVLGWGVGGIEAEAAMLGQPVSMLIPEVIGVRLVGRLREGVTATDLVLTVTETLRRRGVVGRFVEFAGPGLADMPLADRATVANMAPEYGATCGFFPVDGETLAYLRASGRSEDTVDLVERYCKEQGLYRSPDAPEPQFTDVVEIDMTVVEPSVAGPRRPQDRIPLRHASREFTKALPTLVGPGVGATESEPSAVDIDLDGETVSLTHGSIVIASITSCTNTSNPSVIIAAGLLARNARSKGMRSQPWVKASLAPGSRVVRTYLEDAGLLGPLEELGFGIVGHGCTTCIGNSGPLPAAVSSAISEKHLVVCSVLSGNRNFEGRIQQDVRANYLMSPPLVVAYALAGRIDIDLTSEPLGLGSDGSPVFLRDLWPTDDEIEETVQKHIRAEMYAGNYANVGVDEPSWNAIEAPAGQRFAWDPESTYIKRAPYFAGMVAAEPLCVREIRDARVLAWLGDSVTTDHISPAGNIRAQSPAGQWLTDRGVVKDDFNSYGSRRGHDEVMVRGTFANVRIRNRLAGGAEGGVTTHLPSGELMPIYDAAARYAADGTPLIVLAGKEYGSGSSRDWAAKGPFLQGVRAVIAESYERIHRSNLVGMGILPLQFEPGESADALGLTGTEAYSLLGAESVLASPFAAGRRLTVRAVDSTRRVREFGVVVRIDTPKEADYYRNGGILQYVLRQLLGRSEPTAL